MDIAEAVAQRRITFQEGMNLLAERDKRLRQIDFIAACGASMLAILIAAWFIQRCG